MLTEHRHVAGLSGSVQILRDRYGIPHVRAGSSGDAFFAMGFACAEDRIFQMDYDRRRATGRLAEIAGPTFVDADVLARRLDLSTAAQLDVDAMSSSTRAVFEAYAAGVNHALESGLRPLEASLFDFEIEPWEIWHSVAAFKVRHVLMGLWQQKLALATVLQRSGARIFGDLPIGTVPGSPVTVPSGGRLGRLVVGAADEIATVAAHLGFLAEAEPGSNAWAVNGHRTLNGAAVLCNDSHRALDTPNVYWQCHLSCPEFDVVGASFAGVPAFPHFGHNRSVAWAITHVGADTQDLYLESFDPEVPGQYATPEGTSAAERRLETIKVRGAPSVQTEVWATRHGRVVHGDPRRGEALALRYTATDRPCRGFECLLPMLAATSVEEMLDAQRDWVDPVNNFVAADGAGSIGYQTRGEVPLRSSSKYRGLPIPGWTGECEWQDRVPFSEMPREVNPENGYIMTANNVVTAADTPYLSYSFADPFRAERLRGLLEQTPVHTTEGLAAMQADVVSWAAQAWIKVLSDLGPVAGRGTNQERARMILTAWDGRLDPDSPEALVYGCFRREIAEALYSPALGETTWQWMASEVVPSCATVIKRWLANDTWGPLGGPLPPGEVRASDERSKAVMAAVPTALGRAFEAACSLGGPQPEAWRWGDHHQVEPQHPLSRLRQGVAPTLEAAPVRIGGDGDTVQAASYGWRRGDRYSVSTLSVYRQVVDLSDTASASYVIPGGASGDPRSPHFADQLPLWADHRRVPMFSSWDDVTGRAESETILRP